jgi:hypothetical protein
VGGGPSIGSHGRWTVDGIRRIGRDLRHRRNVEAYVIALVTVVFAALSLLGDLAGDDLRWAAALAALGLLVYQVTLPDEIGDIDRILQTRVAFDDMTFGARIRHAKVLWIFGPSAVHLLSPTTAGDLRRTVLSRPDGSVRIAVLDPLEQTAVELAARQLDDKIDFPVHQLPEALDVTVARLGLIDSWDTPGEFEYRFAAFNPGFSLVAVDPQEKDGVVIVEFHGFHNESDVSRMHLELRRRMSEHWYDYWLDQFEHIWASARSPAEPTA